MKIRLSDPNEKIVDLHPIVLAPGDTVEIDLQPGEPNEWPKIKSLTVVGIVVRDVRMDTE